MALYLPPTLHENQLNSVFNNVDFTYQTGSTSLSVTDGRYVKQTGGLILGSLNVSNGISCNSLTVTSSETDFGAMTIKGSCSIGDTAADTLTVNAVPTLLNGLNVTGVSTLNGLVSCGNGLTLGTSKLLTFGDATTQATAFIPANIPTLAGVNTFTGLINANAGITVPSGQSLTIPTQIPSNSSTLGATTAYVTGAISTAGMNMAMTNSTQTFSGINTFNGGTSLGTNLTLTTTYAVPTVNQLGFQIVGSLATNTALTSGVSFNAASISLPAYGTWLVRCNFVLVSLTATQTTSSFIGGLSTVSSTATPYAGAFISNFNSQVIPAGNYLGFDTTVIITPNVVTTCWLNLVATFTGTGTLNAYVGTIMRAVRIA